MHDNVVPEKAISLPSYLKRFLEACYKQSMKITQYDVLVEAHAY